MRRMNFPSRDRIIDQRSILNRFRFIWEVISELRKVTHKPIVVYPNSGELWDADKKRWLPAHEPVDLTQAAVQWQNEGASLIGGCCRTGPDLIRAMRAKLRG